MKLGKLKRPIITLLLVIILLQILLLIFVWMAPNINYTIKLQAILNQNGIIEIQHDERGHWKADQFPLRSGFIGHHRPGFKGHQKMHFEPKKDVLTPALSDSVIDVNFTNDDPNIIKKLSLLDQPWSADTRTSLLKTLEGSLFTSNVGPASDSMCSLPDTDGPAGMCSDNVTWQCSFSPTFVQQDREKGLLHVNCSGDFRVNFVSREESETRLENEGYMPDRVWKTYKGPTTIEFSSQYADVVCPIKENSGTVEHHNYRTQFLPNSPTVQKQQQVFNKVAADNPGWQPLSILAINIDSLSRAQFHRGGCGLPKTAKLLRQLYYTETEEGDTTGLDYQAFMFNRLNSIGGVTAMNLTPLYAGIYFTRSDEEKRVLKHRYPRQIDEWMWQYSNQHGYLTSYGNDNGNGLFGTRTNCKACSNRPGVLPHWEDGWVKYENKQISPGVLSGLCDGDTMIHEHILNYTRDFINSDHPAKWAAMDLNAKHRPEHEAANQIDDAIEDFLQQILKKQKHLVIFLFGDHGDRYHGNFTDHPGSFTEIFLPFLSIIVPRSVLRDHPEWEKNLLTNSQRFLVHYDLHHTMKSLMHYPNLDAVAGHLAKGSYNLFTQVIPRQRTCASAGIPHWSCICGGPRVLSPNKWTDKHTGFAMQAIQEINSKHSKEALHNQNPSNTNLSTSCLDVTFGNLTNVVVYKQEYDTHQYSEHYRVGFRSPEGPSEWEVTVDGHGHIDSLKQLTRYQKYDECLDTSVSIEFCICRQFPDGTP